jgi:hygromycin-B 7''-O-kinase
LDRSFERMCLPEIISNEDFTAHFQSEIWTDAARQICRRHKISFSELRRGASSDHIVFLLDASLVLKIYRPFRNCFEREKKALEFVGGKTGLKIPEIVFDGEFEGFNYLIQTQISGESMTREMCLALSEKEQKRFVSTLARELKQIHELNPGAITCDWAEFVKDRAETFIERQIAHGVNRKVLDALPEFIEQNLKLVPTRPTVFLHGDVHFGNLRAMKINNGWQISGLFDFADSRRAFYEYDFLAVGVLMIQGQSAVQREFFRAYGYPEQNLNETMRRRLMMLTMLYETADLRRYALRLKPEAVDFTLEELERSIWSFV